MTARALSRRLDRLTQEDEWTIVFTCSRCGGRCVGGRDQEGEPCEQHQPAPPPGPRDVTIRWAGIQRTE